MAISYTLIRSARKTISISITAKAEVFVRAPTKLSLDKIEKYVVQNNDWVQKYTRQAEMRQKRLDFVTFKNGSYLYYLGKKVEIAFVPLNSKAIETSDKIYINEKYSKSAQKIILAWYKRTAKSLIEKRIKEICTQERVAVQKVRISTAKTRWGSCSGKNSISISWRLIMAPPKVLDYVIYHELAHIEHKNHSKNFWNQVYMFDNNYKESEKWLKTYGYLLSAVG